MSLIFNPDSSVQLPAQNTFTSSTDATNIKEWSRNNTNNLYNTSLGNIGIGTTTTTTYKLNVNGSVNLTSLYQGGTLIDFANFATDSELTSGLGTKQDKINTYSFSGGSGGSIGFTAGTLSLVMPTSYTTLSIASLTTATAFTYKGIELTTTLNGKQAAITTYTISGATGGGLGFSGGTLTLNMPNNYTTTMSLSNLRTPTSFIYKETELSTTIATKQDTLTAATTLLGTGGSITGINYNTVINKPTYTLPISSNLTTNTISIDLSTYYNKTDTNSLLSAKQATLTAATNLLGIGSAITALDYNNITINKPSVFPADLSTVYTKTEADTLLNTKQATLTFSSPLVNTTNTITFNESAITTLTNFYNKTDTNSLLSAKQATLTAATNLLGIGSAITALDYNNITINKPSVFPADLSTVYNKTEADARYLQLTGGTLTGNLTLNYTNINFQLGGTTGNNIAIPSSAGFFSTSAAANDMVIRSTNNLHLLSGTGNSAITIKATTNNVGIGTNNPNNSFLLHIYSSGTNNALQSIDASGGTGQAGLRLFAGNGTTNRATRIDFYNVASSTVARWTMINDYTQTGTNDFRLVNAADLSRLTILQDGNVGIGITNPFAPLCIGSPLIVSDGALVISKKDGVGFRNFKLGMNANFNFNIGDFGNAVSSSNTWRNTDFTIRWDNGYVGIGTVSANNILQVGGGGRLRIANSTSDYTLIGTQDTDTDTNTRIVLSGNARTGAAGFIDYNTTSTGHHIFNTTDARTERMRITSGGGIAIGTTDPLTYKLNVNGTSYFNDVLTIASAANGKYLFASGLRIAGGDPNTLYNDTYAFGITALNTIALNTGTSLANYTTRLKIATNGNIGIGTEPNAYKLDVNGNLNSTGTISIVGQLIYNYLFNNTGINYEATITDFNAITNFGYTYIRGNTNSPNASYSEYYQWFIGLGANYGASSHGCQFAMPRNTNNPYLWIRYKEGGTWGFWNPLRIENANIANSLSGGNKTIDGNLTVNYNIDCNGTISPTMVSVQNSGNDFTCVQVNTTQGSNYKYPICIAVGTFTGFHRCFTDNEPLFDNENPQKFKDDYEGRIVIATGKIATDTKTNNEEEWSIKYDKGGITIEDAVFMVQLSRTKKDKRVAGVLGMASRYNSRPERLIVNGVGEGAVWVCNSNGNIENGDYITSSDYLGYGEKQDDDLLHNYTVAKATMDCDFQLDSPLYNCIEIQEGLRIAFIACSYHCS